MSLHVRCGGGPRHLGGNGKRVVSGAFTGVALALCALMWSPASAAPKLDEFVKRAQYPLPLAHVTTVGSLPSSDVTPQFTYFQLARAVGGVPLTERWFVGATVNWTHSRAQLSEGDESDWLQALLAGPLVGYTGRRFCLNGTASVGYAGARWDQSSLRTAVSALTCWAPRDDLLLRVAGSVVVRQGGIVGLPLLGARYASGQLEADSLLPAYLWVRYWVQRNWALGGSATGLMGTYAARLDSEPLQISYIYPLFGADLHFRPNSGVTASLTVGAALSPVILRKGEKPLTAGHLSPALGFKLGIDESLFR